MIKRVIPVAATAVVALSLAGCGLGKKTSTSTIFAMDTIMEFNIEGDESLLRDSEEMIRNLESELSVTDENSAIAKLNKEKKAQFSESGTELISTALNICDKTGGTLDITVYPVLRDWGFTTGDYKVPTDSEIEGLLAGVDYSKVTVEGNDVSVPGDVLVDLGSVAKGYAGHKVSEYLRGKGVTSGLINLGGNVECIGSKRGGKPWKVAIKSPFDDSVSGVLGVLDASDVAVITSGGYERFFEENGEKYWHIIDPKTGKPAKSGLISVTVIGKDGTICDGLSTALFVMGEKSAEEFYKKYGSGENGIAAFDLIMVTDDKKVYVTKGVSAAFSLSSEYVNSDITVIGG